MISARLIASLLTWIAHTTGYAIPGTPPVINLVSHAELEDRFCHRSCAILGFTTPEGTILLDDRLRVGEDTAATSILVHELTHYLQRANGQAAVAVTCDLWVARENEAYDVQYHWLHDTSPSIRVLSQAMSELNTHPFLLKCPEGNAATGLPQP
ncbi:MAG TPA: hypothetical protein VM639_02165 [Dongiaceae bacterium]|nr:hypothetical protein [Dongiaceae bacterium]